MHLRWGNVHSVPLSAGRPAAASPQARLNADMQSIRAAAAAATQERDASLQELNDMRAKLAESQLGQVRCSKVHLHGTGMHAFTPVCVSCTQAGNDLMHRGTVQSVIFGMVERALFFGLVHLVGWGSL